MHAILLFSPAVFCSASYFQAKNFVHGYQLDMAHSGANDGPSGTGCFEESGWVACKLLFKEAYKLPPIHVSHMWS